MAMGTQIRMYEKRGDRYPRYRVELPIVSLPQLRLSLSDIIFRRLN